MRPRPARRPPVWANQWGCDSLVTETVYVGSDTSTCRSDLVRTLPRRGRPKSLAGMCCDSVNRDRSPGGRHPYRDTLVDCDSDSTTLDTMTFAASGVVMA